MNTESERNFTHTMGDLLQRVTAAEALLDSGRLDAAMRDAVASLFAEIDALADRLDAGTPETAARIAELVGRASILKGRLSLLRR